MSTDNSSKPSEFFKGKKDYEDLYPDFLENKSYDIWYEVPYFGKVDTLGNLILPRENLIIENIDDGGEIRAVNFVGDAFRELQSFVRLAKLKGAFKSDFFDQIEVKKGYQPLPLLFDQYFEDYIYNPFLNTYLANKTIMNFKCFAKEYFNFAKLISKDGSLTGCGFILSGACTNKISGLILDLTNDTHDDYDTKVDDFLADPDYFSFVNLCESHGFRVNKNAPWQLIADLSSTKMRNLAGKYNIRLDDNKLFDTYYLRVSEVDYYNFKSYLWQMYTDWYAVNSTYSKIKVKMKFNGFSPMFSHFETYKIKELPVEIAAEKENFWAKYGELYFLKLYLRARLIECEREHDYRQLERYLVGYYNLGVNGRAMALRYIDMKVNKSAIYTRDQISPMAYEDLRPDFFELDKKKNKSIIVMN